MSSFKWLNYFTLILIATACSNPTPAFDDVDLQSWKDDKGGCNGRREAMLTAIDNQKDKLLSLREAEVIEVLGKPDENELYKRNQKFFYYQLQPANDCPGSGVERPKKLVIRFNAMGLAKEVSIE